MGGETIDVVMVENGFRLFNGAAPGAALFNH